MLYSSKESRDIEIQCITIYLNNYQFVFIQLEVVCQFHIEKPIENSEHILCN